MLAGGNRIYPEDDEAFSAIAKSIEDQYSETLLAGDSESWLSLWDDDAAMMPNYHMPIQGKQNINIFIKNFMRIFKFVVFDIQIIKTIFGDNIGIVYGNYRETVEYKTGGSRIDTFGKFIDVLKKQEDGTWKIIADFSNTNYP
jgi:ketosteroid isomerase-like protein